MARPKKGLDVLPKDWEAKTMMLYEKGASDVEIRSMLKISDDLWYRWLDEEPRFSRTIKEGRALCETWWQVNGRVNLENKDFNSTLWYMNMKNRFGWADRHDHTSKGEKMETGVVVLPPKKDES